MFQLIQTVIMHLFYRRSQNGRNNVATVRSLTVNSISKYNTA